MRQPVEPEAAPSAGTVVAAVRTGREPAGWVVVVVDVGGVEVGRAAVGVLAAPVAGFEVVGHLPTMDRRCVRGIKRGREVRTPREGVVEGRYRTALLLRMSWYGAEPQRYLR